MKRLTGANEVVPGTSVFPLSETGVLGDFWGRQLNEHEFEQALGVGDGQGGLVCCSPWGCKESDTTEGLNRTELKLYVSQNVLL